MKTQVFVLLGALLIAAPTAFSQHKHATVKPASVRTTKPNPQRWADPRVVNGQVQWLPLLVGPEALIPKLGEPRTVAELGPHFQTLQYQISQEDVHDFSHTFILRKADRKLVSLTRGYEEAVDVKALFAQGSKVYVQQENQYPVLVRRLPQDRLLIAMGIRDAGQKTNQLMLIQREVVPNFVPWLEPLLAADETR